MADDKPVLVAGAAGFLGSNLVDFLLAKGHRVIGLDSWQVGSPQNLRHLESHPQFQMLSHNIQHALPEFPPLSCIYHLACPASPIQYQKDPIDTLDTAYLGTKNLLDLARRHDCRILLSSTSEVYGEPQVHPQAESYWGNVNPFGPRSCYDEGKRAAEALAYAFANMHGTDIRIARIFNTYGPRMNAADGRVVSNFVAAAVAGQPLRITGSGDETRSFQYVEDCLRGLYALMESSYTSPVNIGNDAEVPLRQLAEMVVEMVHEVTGQDRVEITFHPRPKDDPTMRRPDISLAKRVLGWAPCIPLEEGLKRTIEWHRLGES